MREAGATVRTNCFLRDMNVGVSATDGRQVEVLAQGLPNHSGQQLAVDATLRAPVSADGEPKGRAAKEDGAVAQAARRDKEATYPELLSSKRCKLVVVALETGGRWADEAADFFQQVAFGRARSAPLLLRVATARAGTTLGTYALCGGGTGFCDFTDCPNFGCTAWCARQRRASPWCLA